MITITDNNIAYQEYSRMGFSTFPLIKGEKIPIIDSWTPFQNRLANDDEHKAWVKQYPNSNTAIVTGKISGIFVVDCDSQDAYDRIKELIGDVSKIPTVTTPRGFHLYFKYPEFDVRCRVGILNGVDIRGEGGYVVAPPSTLENGLFYSWLIDPDDVGGFPDVAGGIVELLRSRSRVRDTKSDQFIYAEDTLEAYDELSKGSRLLNIQYRILKRAKDKTRNDTLFRVSCECFRISLREKMDSDAIQNNLKNIALEIGLENDESDKTIKSGFEKASEDMISTNNLIRRLLDSKYAKGDSVRIIQNIEGTFDISQYRTHDPDNALLFADLYRGNVVYDHQEKRWYFRNGHLWKFDDKGGISALATLATEARLFMADTIGDPEVREKHQKQSVKDKSYSKLKDLLDLARNQHEIATDGEDWDKGNSLLSVKNGIINLRTGEMIDPPANTRFRKFVNIDYNPSALAPRWTKFLEEIFEGDAELIAWIKKAIGYTMSGEMSEQVFFICHGGGANGKTLFMRILMKLLGLYSYSATSTMFDGESTKQTNLAEQANMQGKRLIAVTEIGEGMRLNEGLIKRITGGDMINARPLYQNNVEFEPTSKLWFAVNHMPRILDQSRGIWRRVITIPFNAVFEGNNADPNLERTLLTELEGILAWAIEGSNEWYQIFDDRKQLSNTLPKVVRDATDEYCGNSDLLKEFMEECIEFGDGFEVGANLLFRTYDQWASHGNVTGSDKLSRKSFGERLKKKNCKWRKKATGIVYYGMRINSTYEKQ